MDSLLAGGSLGRYQIVEQIGRGGMASVFRALDPDLDRHVAVKVLQSFTAEDPTFVERFRQEAQAVARLSHPNVIKVHDFGEDKGFTYIVMEYLTGGTLQDRLGGSLPLPEVLELVSPVADGLGYAHKQGIVHRDIKPANVLLDSEGTPILSDFGLARVMERSAGLTRADSVLGTPEYMSPEQGLGRQADPRSDLYSLGIVVFQMVLGQTPFQGDSPSATLLAHIHQPVPLPTSLSPDVEPRLESVLLKALAKDPEDRYQTSEALVGALALASGQSRPAMVAGSQPTIDAPVIVELPPSDTAVGSTGAETQSSPTETGSRISSDRACILAMQTARESPGEYGRGLGEVSMAFEIAAQEDTEDHYVVTLDFRPQGAFSGTPGQEQFFIEKNGEVAHRQVLSLPEGSKGRGLPVLPTAVGVAAVAVVAVAVVGAMTLTGDGGDDGTDTLGDAASATTAPEATQRPGVAPVAASAATSPAPVQGEGTAVIWDDAALSDAVTYTMSGLAAPSEGKAYVGWLVSDDNALKLSTGAMTPGADGTVTHVFDHESPGYTGVNLIGTYSKIVVTEEDSQARFDTPLGPSLFSHEVPLGAMAHIRHLLTHWPEGTDKGILTNLKEQLTIAHFHATLASTSQGLGGVRQHAEHVINIIEGSRGPNYGDLNEDGRTENPGDDIGVLGHAADRKHGGFALGQAPEDGVIATHAALVESHGKDAAELATRARDKALEVLAAEDVAEAKNLLGPGEGTVIDLLDGALNGTTGAGDGGAARAYTEAQLMASFPLGPVEPSDGDTTPMSGKITYSLADGKVYRVEAVEGATPEDVSQALDALSEGAEDHNLNSSPRGDWLALETERLDDGCRGFACLVLVKGDLTEAELVRVGPGVPRVVHPETGLIAVASGGDLIVYQQEGVANGHISDLSVIRREDGAWTEPVLLTGESTHLWHENPAISDDGTKVAFQCGDDVWNGHSICEVGTDATGFNVVITPADGPAGAPDTATLHNPDYARDGSIVFAADWDGSAIWRLPDGASDPAFVVSEAWWSCVLPDGRIAAVNEDWSGGGSEPEVRLRVVAPDGGSSVTVATLNQVGSMSTGLGCGG